MLDENGPRTDPMSELAEMMAVVAQARWHVYMVKTARGHFYTGISTDPEKRIVKHNRGKKGAKCLRGQRPVELVWRTTQPLTKSDALSLEKQIKKLDHEQKQELIGNDLF